MAGKNMTRKIGNKFAEEMQLIVEEKWILDALSKIKKQRNCLQIERLQLESLKAELNNTASEAKSQSKKETCSASTNVPSSTLDLMQRPTLDTEKSQEVEQHSNFDMDCNMEELNLQVTTPVFKKPSNIDFFAEEEDSDDDNVAIDINMFMNGIEDENTEEIVGL